MGWLRRAALYSVASLVGLAIAGAAYQAIATANDRYEFPPPGKLLDVGGFRLHIQCTGNVVWGVPTVILEPGTGLASPAWALIQASVSKQARVCSYDRAGNGWSDASPMPRDASHIDAELHTLLERAEITGPFILVGHSMGGMYMRAYRDAHPSEVVGLVLVDSSNPYQLVRSSKRSAEIESGKRLLQIVPWLARLGIVRLTGLAEPEYFDMPSIEKDEMTAFAATPQQSIVGLAELSAFPEATALLSKAASLGSLPLVVVSARKGVDADWPDLQADLAKLSSNSVQRTVVGVDHTSLLFSENGAYAVSAAILAVLDAAKTGTLLTASSLENGPLR